MNEKIREALCDMGHEDAVVFDRPDFDEAIVGVTDEGRVVYDYDKMVHCLRIADGMSEEEAIEFIEFNTMRALPYAGEYAPIVMSPLSVERITTEEKRERLIDLMTEANHGTD